MKGLPPARQTRPPTMVDVARVAGVSLKTVSRVVNGVSTVDATLAARVREATAELGFRPNHVAASLRSGVTSVTIAVLIKDMSNTLYGTIAAGAADVARRHHAQLITAHTDEDAVADLEVIHDLCRRRVDGLLIVPSGGDLASLSDEIERGTPMVFLDRSATGLQADSVLIDNVGGTREGMADLISAGHQRIGVVLDALTIPTMADRLQGVRLAFADAKLTLDSTLITTSIDEPFLAARAAEQMLAVPDPPTAFFCGNNRLALGVLEYLWDTHRDQALLSFDDIPVAHLMPHPTTCITYDSRAIGAIGAELLFRRISGEQFLPETVVLPTQLIHHAGSGGSPPP